MSTAREPAEVLAQQFHEAYERLAPLYDYKTRTASAVPWADVPTNNRLLMVAVCAEILRGLSSLRAPQSGPWTYENAGPAFIALRYKVSRLGTGYFFQSEAEAIAVRDALNAVAGSGAETPPQPEIPK